MVRVLLNVPKQVRRDEPFEVKVLISHPMESGQRRDDMGRAIPRDIIHSFTCDLDGVLVLAASLYPAIAANPFLAFRATASRSGTLTMTFTGDHGVTQTETVAIAVI